MRRPAASLLVLTALAGCQLHLAAQYDPTLDQGLSTTYQDIDALLSGIAGGTPSCRRGGGGSGHAGHAGADHDGLCQRFGDL